MFSISWSRSGSSIRSNQSFGFEFPALVLASLLTLFPRLSDAQIPDFPSVGIPVGSTITTDGMDTVILSNLGIHFNIPIRTKSGRGIPFSVNLNFDNQSYGSTVVQGGNMWTFNQDVPFLIGPIGTLHYSYNQFATCTYVDSNGTVQHLTYPRYSVYSYTDGQGTSHPFGQGGSGLPFTTLNFAHTSCNIPLSVTGTSWDGSGIYVSANASSSTITYPSGTQMHPAMVRNTGAGFGQAPTMADSNGNWISESWAAGGYPEIGSFTDTLGTVPITVDNSGAYPNPISYSYVDSSGNLVPSITETFKAYTLQTAFGCPTVDPPATAGNLLDTISLPDGTSYKFTYEPTNIGSGNVTGRVASVNLPTGGVITYQYTGGDTGKGVYCVDGSTSGLKRITPDGTWTYLRGNVTMIQSGGVIADDTTTITDPLSNQTVVSFRWSGSPGLMFETQRQVYNSSATGTPIKATVTCYNGQSPVSSCTAIVTNPYISQPFTELNVYHSLDGGPQSRVDTFFNSYGQVKEEDEYDFGAATATRKTVTTFDTTLGPNINDRPSVVQITDGSGNVQAETDYSYDEDISSLKASGSVQLNAVSCSGKCRGNLTTLTKRVNGTSTITEKFTHYDNGLVYQATDANSNVKTYTYGTCGNSFVTSIAFPLSLTESYTWDCNGGVETQATDFNSQPTTYKYADSLWRVTEIDYPDGGKNTATYSDTANPPNEIKTQLITATLSLSTQTNLDSYGRPALTMLTTDPEGTDNTTISYDGDGRQSQVSNPYRSTSDLTYGTTQTQYDGSGRITKITRQDGSTVTTSYSQNCTTITDEVVKSRKSCVDGLGRVTGVWEDPSGLNYETDYTYDPLNNLLTVTQKGGSTDSTQWRTRNFTYDSLSRLLTANNPESGFISYTYDNNGNVLTKVAPSPNQPTGTATVTASSNYDALNRLTSKGYADNYASNPPTMPAIYGYDGKAISGCPSQPPPGDADTYPLGRRTAMCDGSGATNWTHDKMGRVLQERRTIGSVPGKNETDVYNLDGSVVSTTSLGFQVSYTYNGAGRPLSAIGSNNFVQSNSATYAPFGALTSAKMGPTPIVITNTYNKRLQPILLSAAGVSSIISLCYDFHSKNAVSSGPCSFSAGLGNNGNVFQIVNDRDSNRTQNFLYDSLNRISQAYSSGSNWGETFGPTITNPGVQPTSPGIDAWGNLTNESGVTGKSRTEGLSTTATVKNQLTGFRYDTAGNMTANGNASYVYDAENRLIAAAGTSYIYDGDGKRVKKCTEGTTAGTCATGATGTLYWGVPGGETLTETDLAGNTLENYVYFNGQRIARSEPTSPVHFYFSDHLGTHSLITDANGTMPPQSESDYFPYGGEMPITSGDPNHYKFTGKERDAETCTTACLDYFGARQYGNSLARWTSPDLVNLTDERIINPTNTLNKYAYAGNNPLKYVDPDGRDITVFYDPVGNAGHIVLLAYNQQTGDSAVQSFGEANHGLGTVIAMGLGISVAGKDNYALDDITSADQLRQAYTSITIQTTPEEAQQAIDYIKTHPDGKYNVLSNNCTTTCNRILRRLKLTTVHDITPIQFFSDLSSQYGNNYWLFTGLKFRSGVDYGYPRWRYDPFDLLFQHERHLREHVTHKIKFR